MLQDSAKKYPMLNFSSLGPFSSLLVEQEMQPQKLPIRAYLRVPRVRCKKKDDQGWSGLLFKIVNWVVKLYDFGM